MDQIERARELFQSGYNCCQAVVGAYAEALGLDFDEAMRLSAALGGGVGRMREVCGAVLGMGIVLGLHDGSADPKDRGAKAALYARMQALGAQFREENGSIVCRELLGRPEEGGAPATRDEKYYKKRPCVELVGCAAGILKAELNAE